MLFLWSRGTNERHLRCDEQFTHLDGTIYRLCVRSIVTQMSFVHQQITVHGLPVTEIKLHRQLMFYNELFSWARVAFQALTGRPPPDILYGPSSTGDSIIAREHRTNRTLLERSSFCWRINTFMVPSTRHMIDSYENDPRKTCRSFGKAFCRKMGTRGRPLLRDSTCKHMHLYTYCALRLPLLRAMWRSKPRDLTRR